MHPVLSTVVCPQMCTDVSLQDKKGGRKSNWIKPRCTHDHAHALQTAFSLKSQQGVSETISIRSLGFVICCGKEVAERIKARPWKRGPATRVTEPFLMSGSQATWSSQFSHTSNTSCGGDCGWRSCTWFPLQKLFLESWTYYCTVP